MTHSTNIDGNIDKLYSVGLQMGSNKPENQRHHTVFWRPVFFHRECPYFQYIFKKKQTTAHQT